MPAKMNRAYRNPPQMPIAGVQNPS